MICLRIQSSSSSTKIAIWILFSFVKCTLFFFLAFNLLHFGTYLIVLNTVTVIIQYHSSIIHSEGSSPSLILLLWKLPSATIGSSMNRLSVQAREIIISYSCWSRVWWKSACILPHNIYFFNWNNCKSNI